MHVSHVQLFVAHLDGVWDKLTITELVFMTMTSKGMHQALFAHWPLWLPLLKKAEKRTNTADPKTFLLSLTKGKTGGHLTNSRCHACLRPRAPRALTKNGNVIHLCVRCATNSTYHRLVTSREVARAKVTPGIQGASQRKGTWRLKTRVVNQALHLARRRPAGGAHLYWAFPLEKLGMQFV